MIISPARMFPKRRKESEITRTNSPMSSIKPTANPIGLRKGFASHVPTLKRFCYVVVHKDERLFEKRLEPPRYHREASSDEERKSYQDCYHHPARDERVGDGNTKEFPELFRRNRYMNPLFHCGDSSIFDLFHPSPNCPCDLLFRPAEQVPRAGNDDCFALLKVFFEPCDRLFGRSIAELVFFRPKDEDWPPH